jgi:hypothetical protein
MSPREVGALQGIARQHGGSLTVNPQTGLAEAGFLDAILPMVAGAGLSMIPGVGPLMAAGIVGAGTGLLTKDLNKGLMAGLGAFGGASLAGSLMSAGSAAGSTAAAAETAAAAGSLYTPAEIASMQAAGLSPAEIAASAADYVGGASGVGTANMPFSQATQSALNNPAMAGLSEISKAPGAFFKKNMFPIGAAAAPLLLGGGDLFGGGDQKKGEESNSYIRPQTYTQTRNPNYTGAGTPYFTQSYTAGEPVLASEWGNRSFAEGGTIDPLGIAALGPQATAEGFAPTITYDPVTKQYVNITPTAATTADNNFTYDAATQRYINAAPAAEAAAGLPAIGNNQMSYMYGDSGGDVSGNDMGDAANAANAAADAAAGVAAGEQGSPGADGNAGADGNDGADGGCVDPDVLILMQDGSNKRAGDVAIGDLVHSPHEHTLVYGDFKVTAADVITQPKLLVKFFDGTSIKVSDSHKFLMADDTWKQMLNIKLGDEVKGISNNKKILGMEYIGDGDVIKFNIDEAHTYVSEGLVSHNSKKEGGFVKARYAEGGITNAKMATVQKYMSQAQGSARGMQEVLALAKAGDYNASVALNQLNDTPNQNYAMGGITSLGSYSDGGRLLKGPGDGVSDSIPAIIGSKQPARLANEEFVVPARIVSEIGNGSSEAGAKRLYAMMDRVQEGREKSIGEGKVAVDSKAYKHLPA